LENIELESDLHKQSDTAQDQGTGDVEITACRIPEGTVRAGGALVDLVQ
jgi:hypothetical protein